MNQFKIGNVNIENPLVLAPLAGITNLPFREICKKNGAGLVCSEMVSSNGLIYNSSKTFSFLKTSAFEKPVSIQIFGYDPQIMANAAKIVQDNGADILDINMGCSVKKILKSGSGSALMKDPERTQEILRAVRKAIDIPLTIKIRTGWENSGDRAELIAKIAENEGVNAIAVHPRTAPQGFSGTADWSVIKRIKEKISIPVIGNGDVTQPEHVLQMLDETGCDGVMIGRASISNPFIFRNALALLKKEKITPVPQKELFELMEYYLKSTIEYFGEETGCKMMRSRLAWFVKGLPHNIAFKETIKTISSEKTGIEIINEYKEFLQQRDEQFQS